MGAARGCGKVMLAVGAVVVGLAVVFAVIVVMALRNLDFDFRSGCDESEHPLIRAASAGNRKGVAHELHKGTDPDLVIDDVTALECAASRGRVETVELLLERGAHPTPSTLKAAVGWSTDGFAFPNLDTD